jgi:hypothetical protein
MIDVEQRTLRSLEKNCGAALERAMHCESHIVGKREQSLGDGRKCGQRFIHRGALAPTTGSKHCIRVRDTTFNQRAKPVGIPQIQYTHSAPSNLVFVCWTNSATCGSDLFAGRALRIDQLVVRENQVCAIAHIQSPLHVDSVGTQLVDLGEQRCGIEHDTISYRTANACMQNSARHLMEHEGFVADMYSVACISAALIPDYPGGMLGENVNELPLSFVTPLRAHDNDRAPALIEHSFCF